MATELEKVSFHSNPKERQWQRMLKLLHNFISRASEVMLKILQVRLLAVHEPRISRCSGCIWKRQRNQGSNCRIRWIIEKARELQKNICFCFIDYPTAFVWITTNCGKFFKRWEYQITLPAS